MIPIVIAAALSASFMLGAGWFLARARFRGSARPTIEDDLAADLPDSLRRRYKEFEPELFDQNRDLFSRYGRQVVGDVMLARVAEVRVMTVERIYAARIRVARIDPGAEAAIDCILHQMIAELDDTAELARIRERLRAAKELNDACAAVARAVRSGGRLSTPSELAVLTNLHTEMVEAALVELKRRGAVRMEEEKQKRDGGTTPSTTTA